MQVVSERRPTEAEWSELLFAWRVCKHVRSNAIVLARDLATVGIGAGQMSRVDSVRLAIEKARSELAGARDGLRCLLPVRRRARSSRSRPGSPRSSSREDRSATPTSWPPSTRPAWRWCSPAAGTSGIEHRRRAPARRSARRRGRAATGSAAWSRSAGFVLVGGTTAVDRRDGVVLGDTPVRADDRDPRQDRARAGARRRRVRRRHPDARLRHRHLALRRGRPRPRRGVRRHPAADDHGRGRRSHRPADAGRDRGGRPRAGGMSAGPLAIRLPE